MAKSCLSEVDDVEKAGLDIEGVGRGGQVAGVAAQVHFFTKTSKL